MKCASFCKADIAYGLCCGNFGILKEKGEIFMRDLIYFRSDISGNIVGLIEDAGIPVVCCGQDMTELVANTSEGAYEKHLPLWKRRR